MDNIFNKKYEVTYRDTDAQRGMFFNILYEFYG